MKKLFILLLPALFFFAGAYALPAISSASGSFSVCVHGYNFLYDDSTGSGVWTSSNTGIAVIDSTGTIYGVSAGTVTISFTEGGATVTTSFVVNPMPSAITGSTTVCVGSTSTLADATSGGTWTSDAPGIAAIDATTGVVTGVFSGSALITYGTGTGCVVTDTINVGVFSGYIFDSSMFLCSGGSRPLTAAVSGGVWSSSDTSIATVSTSGVVTGVSDGAVVISYAVTNACGVGYAFDDLTVTSSTFAGSIVGSTIDYIGYTYYYGASGTSATGGTWSISDPSVATIDASGTLLALSAGVTTLTYTVSGCGGTAYTILPVRVLELNTIDGDIYFGSGAIDTTHGGTIKVWLITYDSTTMDLEAIDSTYAYVDSTDTVAHYQFIGEAANNYRVKAAFYPATFSSTGYIPTYYYHGLHWSTANVFTHSTTIPDAGIDVHMYYGATTAGAGFIGGSVSSGADRGTSGTIPVPNLLMMAINTTTGALAQYTYTDASGNYSFSSLAEGQTYMVYPEQINYETTPFVGLALSSSTSTVSGVNFIKHTVSKTITPANEGVAPVATLQTIVTVFPNPSNGNITVYYSGLNTGNATLIVTDIAGRQVYNALVSVTKGIGTQSVDLSALNAGIYIVKLTAGSETCIRKIEINK